VKLFEKEISLLLILVLFSASLFLIGLGAMPLTDPDEVFYAETAREMLSRDEFLTPYIFGKPQFEKPPLYYWLVVLSFRAFGVNEFSARFPSCVIGILGVICVYLLGKLFVNKRTGFFAGLVLATCVKYLVLSRACVTDIALGVLTLASFLFFFYGYFAKSGKTKWYLLSACFLGLSVLTKGPVGVFLPFVIIGIYFVLAKELNFKRLKEIPFIRGTLLFLVVAVPWYILMHRVHGKEFIDVFFGFHNITRFLHPEHKWGDYFYYYVPVIAVGFFPWTAFLPLGIWQAVREKEKRIRSANLFLAVWFSVILIFFSISRTKLPTYIFPLYPALALLLGRTWDVFLKKNFSKKQNAVMRISLFAFAIIPVGGIIGLYIATKMRYPAAANPTLITGVIFILLMTIFLVVMLKKRYKTGLIIFMLSFLIIAFPLSYYVLPEIGKYVAAKEISEKALTLIKPGEVLGAETRYRRGVAFYTNREDTPDVHSHDVITKLLKRNERVWCIIKEKNHIQLYTDEKTPYDRPTYVVYQYGKKVLLTNKVPPGVKVLKVRTKNDPY